MAYFKITKGAKNKLKAKIQVSGKDFSENRKVFYKTVYNVENLTEAKFKKYVNQEALKFENEMVLMNGKKMLNKIYHITTI